MTKKELEIKANIFLNQITNEAEREIARFEKEQLLRNYTGSDKIVSFESIYEETKLKPFVFIETGHPQLDRCLGGGLLENDLVIITGFSGYGKSSFCFDLTRKLQKYNPLWFPFEETAEDFARKLILWNKEPIKFFTPANLLRQDIDWIEERILESVLKNKTKLVFIDNIHYLTMTEDLQRQFGITGVFMKKLKEIAEKMNVCIVVIAHLRKSKDGIHKMPTFEDVSGSSDSVKLAKKVLCLQRNCKKELDGTITQENGSRLAVQKVRGANGSLEVIDFEFDRGFFMEKSSEALIKELNNFNY